jgi:hemoglobin
MRTLLLVCLLAFGTSSAFAGGDAKAPAKTPAADAKKAPDPAKDAKPAKSLYDRLGGKAAITKVVDDFTANVVADKAINKRFAKTDAKKFKATLVDQICEATGGPCKYKGKSMADAHKGMKITEDEWKATVTDLVKALDKNKVPQAEKDDLLKPLAAMHDDIVGK